jgi:hypothetical protein
MRAFARAIEWRVPRYLQSGTSTYIPEVREWLESSIRPAIEREVVRNDTRLIASSVSRGSYCQKSRPVLLSFTPFVSGAKKSFPGRAGKGRALQLPTRWPHLAAMKRQYPELALRKMSPAPPKEARRPLAKASQPNGKGSSDHGSAPSVGYGRPPVHTRFKPGQSGNPRGRRKGQRNVSTVLAETLNQRIRIRELIGPAHSPNLTSGSRSKTRPRRMPH